MSGEVQHIFFLTKTKKKKTRSERLLLTIPTLLAVFDLEKQSGNQSNQHSSKTFCSNVMD